MPFERICIDCGDIKLVSAKKNIAKRCVKCAQKISVKNMQNSNIGRIKENKVKHWSFCPHCSSITTARAIRKSHRCENCSKLYAKKIVNKYYFCFSTMSIKKITLVKHREKKAINAVQKPIKKATAIKPKKEKKYSKIGVDGKQKVKLDSNKFLFKDDHAKDIQIRKITTKEKEMIENFLNKR